MSFLFFLLIFHLHSSGTMAPPNFGQASRCVALVPLTKTSIDESSLNFCLWNVAVTCSSATAQRSPSRLMYTLTTSPSSRNAKLSRVFGAGPLTSVVSAASNLGSGFGAAASPCATLSCQSASANRAASPIKTARWGRFEGEEARTVVARVGDALGSLGGCGGDGGGSSCLAVGRRRGSSVGRVSRERRGRRRGRRIHSPVRGAATCSPPPSFGGLGQLKVSIHVSRRNL